MFVRWIGQKEEATQMLTGLLNKNQTMKKQVYF